MTTAYTDAQIEAQVEKLSSQYLSEAIPACKEGADMLRALLAERKAAIQPQGGEVVAEVVQREPYLDGSPNPMKDLNWSLDNCQDDLPVGTKLCIYTPAKPPQHVHGDGGDVREGYTDSNGRFWAAEKKTPVRSVSDANFEAFVEMLDIESESPVFISNLRAALEAFQKGGAK